MGGISSGEMMTPDKVRELVENIGKTADDAESAHGQEDDLYATILQAIADGKCVDAQTCAIEALKTVDIKFPRWCA